MSTEMKYFKSSPNIHYWGNYLILDIFFKNWLSILLLLKIPDNILTYIEGITERILEHNITYKLFIEIIDTLFIEFKKP